jgi:uncharacterized membrane protein YdbT with pleckstrin-like domain
MGSRARRRASRKRKQRASENNGLAAAAARRAAESERRNQEARERLEPLAPGERPTVVTIGAVISAVLSLSVIAGWIAGVEVTTFDDFGNEVGEQRPNIVSALVPALLMGVMAWGMWRAKYWAVLGFQALLAILIIATALGLVAATSWRQVVGNIVILAVAGTLFFRMVKAMARIQMPERRPPGGR